MSEREIQDIEDRLGSLEAALRSSRKSDNRVAVQRLRARVASVANELKNARRRAKRERLATEISPSARAVFPIQQAPNR